MKTYLNINSIQDKSIPGSKLEESYVSQENGKGLSTNDFTDILKNKLLSLNNYDDSELNEKILKLEQNLNSILGEGSTEAIENFNEIISFLSGIEDSESLDNIIAAIELQISDKQDKINDLQKIREGASKGETALQEIPEEYITENELENKGYLTEHQDITPEILQNENEVAIKVGNNTSGYTTINYSKFSNDLTGRIEATPEEFTFRPSAGDKSIRDESALIKKIKGNTIVWNQLINITSPVNIDFTNDTTQYYQTLGRLNKGIRIIKGHKYIGTGYVETNINTVISFGISNSMNELVIIKSYGTGYYERIIEAAADRDSNILCINNYQGQRGFFSGDYVIATLNLFDLTQMFGDGNEPTTVEEFKALFPNNYYDYNAGELVSMTSNGLFANGFNQWDEEWEKGTIASDTGDKLDDPTYADGKIRSTNYIEVLPNAQYYCGKSGFMYWEYDNEYNFIPTGALSGLTPTNGLFTTSSNCRYIRFRATDTKYLNDININLSHTGVRNGEYEPYWDATKDLSIIQKYFPNGMRSAGSICDEISFDEATQKWVAIQRVGSVDLGSLSWSKNAMNGNSCFFSSVLDSKSHSYTVVGNSLMANYRQMEHFAYLTDADNKVYVLNSNAHTPSLFAIRDTSYTDATAFKTAMSGVMLYYELVEPIITTIEEPIDLSYKVGDFGIEKMLSDSFSAPFKADIIYQFNATDRVRENSMNISKLSKKHTLLESKVDREIANITTELEEVGENFFPLTGTLPANQIGEFKANTTNNGKEREWSLATAKIDYLRGNRLAFLQSSEFTIEHSYDNGATWETRNNTTQAALTLWADQPWGSPLSFGSSFTIGAMLRITIKPNSARQGLIEMLAIKFFENGGKFNIKVESNTSSAQDVWTEQCNVSPSTTTWCPTYLISYGKWLYGANNYHLRLIFTALNDGAKNSSLIAIGAYGLSTGVTTQVTPQLAMARLGHMYNWDYLQNVQFPNKVTASAFAKAGGTSSQILMADGSTKTDAGLSINYSQVGLNTYGQKVFAGVPVVLSPNIDVIRPNHLAFLQDDEYVVERSDDSGETWNEVAKTDGIRRLFIGNNTGNIGIKSAPEKMLRITIKPIGRYTQYEWLYLYTNSPYDASNPPTTVTVEYSTGGAPDTWIGAVTAPINGQPAPNVVGLGVRNLGGSGSVGYGLRLTFKTTVTSATQLSIFGIELHGTRIYTAKNNMMRWSHLYSTDASQNASFPAKVTATEFNTTNGKALTTDAQTLTADQKAQVATNLGGNTTNGLVRYVGGNLPVQKISAPDANGVEQTYVLPNASDDVKASATGGVLATEDTIMKFSNDLTGVLEATPETFTFRPSAGDKSIRDESAVMRSIKGNTIVWNQRINKDAWFVRQGAQNAEIIGNYIKFNCVSVTSIHPLISQVVNFISGHKYIIHLKWEATTEKDQWGRVLKCETNNDLYGGSQVDFFTSVSEINDLSGDKYIMMTASGDAKYLVLGPRAYTNDVGQYFKISVNLFDLTQMFGAGNEPTTVEEFKALFPDSYYPYCESELRSVTTKAIETVGFNQFNGEYAEVLPNNAYYLGGTYTTIGFTEEIGGTTEDITIPDNKLYTPTKKGYIYATGTNICINLSHSGVRNGEYQLYEKHTRELPEIVKYFPNGMRSAGSIYDEIRYNDATEQWEAVQRVESVDLGNSDIKYDSTRTAFYLILYNSKTLGKAICPKFTLHNVSATSLSDGEMSLHSTYYLNSVIFKATSYTDVSSFKSAMSGVMLYYELAEPIITPIEEPIQMDYWVEDFGTEEAISDTPSAPFKADVVYQFNAEGRIRDNSRNIERLEDVANEHTTAIEGKLSKPQVPPAQNSLLMWDGESMCIGDSGVGVAEQAADIANAVTDSVPTSAQVKEYVDELIGDINSVLESIINS